MAARGGSRGQNGAVDGFAEIERGTEIGGWTERGWGFGVSLEGDFGDFRGVRVGG